MAFTIGYGSGNWLGLPELGITEFFGGNTDSVINAGGGNNTAPSQPTYNYNGTQSFAPDILPTGAWDFAPPSNGTPITQNNVGTYTFEGQSGLTEKEYQDAYNKAIENSYNDAIKRLNSQSSALKDNEQNFYNVATAPYTSQIPLVQQAGAEGESALGLQQQKAGLNEQNALAAARRLYDELTSRNRQAFGSGALGSVGQAASEILGRTAQQGMGSVRNQAAETYNNIAVAVTNLKAKVKAQLDSLEQQKQAALSQAKLAFQEKIDYINDKKNEAAQAKAQNKLDAMREYRDYVRSIEQQGSQLASSLTNQANAAYNDLINQTNSTKAGIAGNVNTGVSAVGNQGQANASAYNSMGQGNIVSSAAPADTLSAITGNTWNYKKEEEFSPYLTR